GRGADADCGHRVDRDQPEWRVHEKDVHQRNACNQKRSRPKGRPAPSRADERSDRSHHPEHRDDSGRQLETAVADGDDPRSEDDRAADREATSTSRITREDRSAAASETAATTYKDAPKIA